MAKSVLFIDGENFLHKVEQILKEGRIDKDKIDLALIDLNKLFKEPLKAFDISRKIFYVSRLHFHPETNPNKGLSYTTNRTILLRNSEVMEVCPKGG